MSTYSSDEGLTGDFRIEGDPVGASYVDVAASTRELDVRLTIGDSRWWMQPEVAERIALALIRQAGVVRRASGWTEAPARDAH